MNENENVYGIGVCTLFDVYLYMLFLVFLARSWRF